MRNSRTVLVTALLGVCLAAAAGAAASSTEKIPITTASTEARELYLKGRDLFEKLRATDARRLFEQAAAKDPAFALAYLGLANTAGTAKEFFEALNQAVAKGATASEPERLLICGVEAGVKGDSARQLDCLTKLTARYPRDERAQNLLGGYYFGRQDWATSIEHYTKAITIAPDFSQPYNQLGYAYRFLGKYPEAERTFKKYTELVPADPNPYDSYAELLMKTGRFDDSIRSYQKALSLDPNFVASYVGIANNQIFLGHGDAARQTLDKMLSQARNEGEQRLALFWIAESHLHQGAYDAALAAMEKEAAVAIKIQDLASLSADQNFMGNILLEAGRPDAAAEKFAQSLETIDKADTPAETKQAAHRNSLRDAAHVALARQDLAGAKAKAAEYARQVAVLKLPFEVRQQHELNGRIALLEKRYPEAVAELEQANDQDPRALYWLALALQGMGDAAQARTVCTRAADFNGLAGNYAFVRAKAKDLLASLKS